MLATIAVPLDKQVDVIVQCGDFNQGSSKSRQRCGASVARTAAVQKRFDVPAELCGSGNDFIRIAVTVIHFSS